MDVTPLTLARWVNLVSSALATGVFFGTRAALSPSTRDFSGAVYTPVQQATIANLKPVMGALMPASVVSHVAVLALLRDPRARAFRWTAASLALTLVAGASTVRRNFPINDQVETWAPDALPADWRQLRDRWERLHTFRTLVVLAGLGALVAGNVSSRKEP